MTNPFEGKRAKFIKGHITLQSNKSARNTALHNASHVKGTKVSKQQLYRESIPHLEKMAAKEHEEKKDFIAKHGTFKDRLDKFAKWKKNG